MNTSTIPVEASRRPAIVVVLHWLTLVPLLLGVLLILLRDEIDGRSPRYWLLEAHRHLGLLVFALLLARLTVRLARHCLPPLDATSRFARAIATLTHLALYLLLACVPLLGWTVSNAHGQDVHLLGVLLPAIAEANDDLADTLQKWHAIAAWSLLALGLVHAMAALWHHFVRRDQVLVAMLPRRARRRTSASDDVSASGINQ